MIIETYFNCLTLSLLMTTQEAFVNSVDQDQTVQNVRVQRIHSSARIYEYKMGKDE